MNLPDPISAYFEADRNINGDAPTDAFSPNATVFDEGQGHVGHEAIASWWRAAKRKYRHTAVPLELREADGATEVRAMVTGEFPGSPAPLTFVFSLDGKKITSLKIGA